MNARLKPAQALGPEALLDTIREHAEAELERLDVLILRRIVRFRSALEGAQRGKTAAASFISDEEIDGLLSDPGPSDAGGEVEAVDAKLALVEESIRGRLADASAAGIVPPLMRLARLFGLSRFELDALVVCLAPELNRKYDRIYAYLQDDITRKRPSADLVLDLCCPTQAQRWQLRGVLGDSGLLLRSGLLQVVEDPQSPSGCSDLARFLSLDRRVVDYVLGSDVLDARLQDFAWLAESSAAAGESDLDAATRRRVDELIRRRFSANGATGSKLLVHLSGPQGSGKTQAALVVCAQLNAPLLILDGERLPAAVQEVDHLLKLACRESLLLRAPLLIRGFDAVVEHDGHGKTIGARLAWLAAEYGWLTFAAGSKPWRPSSLCDPIAFEAIRIGIPDVGERRRIWENALRTAFGAPHGVDVDALAQSFRLGPGQIHEVVRSTGSTHGEKAAPGTDRLASACRRSSNRLEEMATKVEAKYGWNDIVLPDDTFDLLREICSQARQMHRVLNEWGFRQKVPYGRGLSVLFSGPPGTGKTMAAQIIARDLNLDLYKIDLSRVVSKYIGETEKNLSRIFADADMSNAVVFFDEADALFGKRTEVSDAHDRYANIEVSYLLQKMEEYDGIVILATNLRKNMDEAFLRRIRFIVEYPFPDERSRLEIWRKHFPSAAPRGDDIDFDLLARKVKVSGGNIKNIVLNAAFRAATAGSEICMEHLAKSTRREFEKIGKLWSEDTLRDAARAGEAG